MKPILPSRLCQGGRQVELGSRLMVVVFIVENMFGKCCNLRVTASWVN